jgi:hypothetical protein
MPFDASHYGDCPTAAAARGARWHVEGRATAIWRAGLKSGRLVSPAENEGIGT